jgi:hypothetical protein
MKKLKIFIAVILFHFSISAKEKDLATDTNKAKLNSIYLELGGVGEFNSLNFERLIPFNSKMGLSVSAGFSFNSLYYFMDSPTVPVNIKTYYQINSRHLFDAGIGFTPWYSTLYYDWASFNDLIVNLTVGYRFSFYKNRWNLGVSFTPEIFYETGFRFIPWGGVRLGYKFNKIEHRKVSERMKNSKHKMQNISSSIGFYNDKLRIQYERALDKRKSCGVQLVNYFGWFFYGLKTDLFVRWYAKKEGNMNGGFIQAKVGAAMFNEYQSNKGFVFGGGLACGYKIMIGNHLNLEPMLGLHLYNAPLWTKGEPNYIDPNKDSWHLWYNTIGHPIDYQLKLGWMW